MANPRRTIQVLVPTMFHRRLVLLGVLIVGGFVAMGARVSWMTAVDGAEARRVAESRLVRWSWIPTTRGRILDRAGRVLAEDRASYQVAVEYAVLSGEWAQQRGRRAARRANKDTWDLMTDAQRGEIAARFAGVFQAHADAALRVVAQRVGVEREALERSRRRVVERVDSVYEAIVAARVANGVERLERRGFLVSEEQLENIRAGARQPIKEQKEAHVVIESIDDAAAFEVMRLAAQRVSMELGVRDLEMGGLDLAPLLPGIEILDATRRETPHATQAFVFDRRTFPGPLRSGEPARVVVHDVGTRLLGRVRADVYAEDAQRRRSYLEDHPEERAAAVTERGIDRGRYLNADRVGHTGLERGLEFGLRGLRGVRTEDLQSGDVDVVDPEAGRDVTLTIDAALSGRIKALMDPALGLTRVQPWHANEVLPVGTVLDGAVVVLDVERGEILAMVSSPTLPGDGDWSRLGVRGEQEEEWFKRVRSPHVHRAYETPYQPGSVAKALVLCGAAKFGAYQQGERIEATGHLYPERPGMLRSWIFKDYGITHGDQLGRDPDASDALMVSSNVFFFTLGQRLGPGGIRDAYGLFHVGRRYDLGLPNVWGGSLGAFTDGGTAPISAPDAIQMGIGQGPVTWTPVHAADAYATIARGGYHIEPTLVKRRGAPRVTDLGIPSWATDAALDGLRRVVEDPDYGTGHHVTFDGAREPTFNAPGVTVWGKTGTATSSPLVVDPDGDGPRDPLVAREGDHSWYVSLVGPEGGSPKYAIAVVIDYGGSGGRVSGPINNQVVHALIAEGYLPRADASGGGGS